MSSELMIRDLRPEESEELGRLVVEFYSGLDGFPTPAEQPHYYTLLADIGRLACEPGARVLVALTAEGELVGGVVYFGEMAEYGSGGSALAITDASGVRLLAVRPRHRNLGAGKSLTRACIELARQAGRSQVILPTTQAMHVAWRMYEKLGFVRSEDLDFLQQGLPVSGFRQWLN